MEVKTVSNEYPLYCTVCMESQYNWRWIPFRKLSSLIQFLLFVFSGAVTKSWTRNSFCSNIDCQDEFCQDGSLAPRNGCCPDLNQCPENSISETNSTFGSRDCSAIGCLTELCPNGDIPPTPEGRCCPSALLCPRDNCDTVRCKVERCQDGSVAPVPVGQCCPDAFYCFDNIVKCAEVDCPLQYCPNGDLAPVPAGQCCPDPDLCPYKQCDHVTCIPEFCPTGQLAPIPVGQCCPKSDQCNNTNCNEVKCLIERCPDGQIAPRPPGMCCPSLTQCSEKLVQTDDYYYDDSLDEFLNDVTTTTVTIADDVRLGLDHDTNDNNLDLDCANVTCVMMTCQDENIAPTPPGSCCPNEEFCPDRCKTSHNNNTNNLTKNFSFSFSPDCRDVACFVERCSDGSRAPVPPGRCCPDRSQCLIFSNDIEDWAL